MKSFSSLFFLLFLICGCQFQVPKDPYVLVNPLPGDPETLNPVTSTSAYSSMVFGYIYEQLFDLDNETLQPKPKLATSWEISEDHLHYTFHLRPNVFWQDGKPLTADDVLYTYEKIKDPKVDAAPHRNYFRDVLEARKIDTHTVLFTYREPYVGALYTLGLMMILPKHIFDDGNDFNSHPRNRNPVGCGPFRFVEWKTGERIVLTRSESYWGKAYPFQRVVFKIIPNEIVTFQLFKKKEVDLVDLNAIQWSKQTDTEYFQKNFVKHKLLTRFGVYSYMGWNLRRPFFEDQKVRRALAHLVDRELINQKLLGGIYFPITGPYYPFGPNYDTNLPLIRYDLGKAKQLLEESGWRDTNGDGIREKNGVRFQFTLLFSSGVQLYEQLTPILREEFGKAGIELNLRRLEAISMFRMMHEHDFDAYIAAWGRGAGEEDLYQIWHSSQAASGSNYVGYQNPKVDQLLEEGRRTFDEKKRSEIYKQVHRILYEDQAYLFLYARPDLVARDRRFKNVKEYPGGFDMREWEIEKDL